MSRRPSAFFVSRFSFFVGESCDANNEKRKTKNEKRVLIAALLIAFALIAPEATACPVCYGSPGDPLVKGANNGVAVLLGIIVLVQVGFAALFISFWRRARALQRRREQFHVIEGGAR